MTSLTRCRRSLRRLLRCDDELPPDVVDALWSDPDALVRAGAILKDGDRSTVARSRDLVIKRYNLRGPAHTAVHAFMRSRAAWNVVNASLLDRAGLLTPAPRAVIEERWGPLRGRSFLVVAHVAGPTLLDVVAAGADGARLDGLAEAFADAWRRLGDLGVGHDDMKASNFVVDRDDRLWLLDLDGMRVLGHGVRFRRQRRLDLERFMRNWDPHPAAAAAFRARIDRAARPGA